MKALPFFALSTLTVALSSCCSNCNQNNVVSQKYIHKYGFDLSKDEWEAREEEGKIVTFLENGVKYTESYENGILHGSSHSCYPYSETIEKSSVYDQGMLVKEIWYDRKGIPLQEIAYEFDRRKMITLWDQNGAPLSVEEYEGDQLMEASYFNSLGDIEAHVENGNGTRIKRDRSGKLLLKDQMENGALAQRTTFHPNEAVESVSHFANYVLHGEQKIFTPEGKLLMKANWSEGTLEGTKVSYRDGVPFLEVPYVKGKKQGVERRIDEDGRILQETSYYEDEKHGPTIVHHGKEVKESWFYKGKAVTPQKYALFDNSYNSPLIAENLPEDSSQGEQQ